MPREQINYPKRSPLSGETDGVAATEVPTGEQVMVASPTVHVGWHKDSWVQVSIEGDLSYFRFAANSPDGSTGDRSTVYTEPLTRDEINKMIRVLRRAREQAFGRDE